jgi:hypothetical protein
MNIESFVQNCEQLGIHLWPQNGQICYRAKQGAMTQEIITNLKNQKSEILAYLNYLKDSDLPFQMTATSKDRAPFFDRVIWNDYPNRKMPIGVANICHIVIRHKGTMRSDVLINSIKLLLERHKVLNSAIQIHEGILYLTPAEKDSPEFQEFVIKSETMEDREKKAMKIANDFVWKEYDLDQGPLYRVFLIRITETDFILGAGLHHAVGDGISIGILFQELAVIYSSIESNIPCPLPPVKFQFKDFLSSMETWLASPAGNRHTNYWTNLLKSTPETHLVAVEHLPKVVSSQRIGEQGTIDFNESTTNALKEIAARLKTTIFTVLLAVHKVALWRMTDQKDLVIVVIRAGRITADLQTMVGNFALETAYKTNLDGNPSFSELVERLKLTMIEADTHQPIPFDWVRRQLKKEGISFLAPTMGFQPEQANGTEDDSKPQLLKFPLPSILNDFPGTYGILFREGQHGIKGTMMYRKDLYEETTVHAFMNHFRETVSDLISHQDIKLHDFAGFKKNI